MKNLTFCITCMNRLRHLQKTLLENIKDNDLAEDIEFLILDYNSSDGLEDWVKQNFIKHINSGLLVYYRNITPAIYDRSHSRNMAFKLSNSEIVCNLDADNYSGNGFAFFLMENFKKNNNVFYTSDLSIRDIGGRIAMLKDDFIRVRGYNEIFSGYGFEDVDIVTRLNKNGIKQNIFYNREFYRAIKHSHKERVSEESLFKNWHKAYLSYISPFKTMYVLLKKDFTVETGLLINNKEMNANLNILEDPFSSCFDEKFQTVLTDFVEGFWKESKENIIIVVDEKEQLFKKDGQVLTNNKYIYYELEDAYIENIFLLLLIGAKNFKDYIDFVISKKEVNSNGFGIGTVYKNFDYSKPIFII